MAQYDIVRSECPGGLTTRLLSAYLQAFNTLYVSPSSGLKTVIKIEGCWPAAYNGEGLFLQWVPAEIISIGRKFVWIKYTDGTDQQEHRIQLELCPTPETGFTEIRFYTERVK